MKHSIVTTAKLLAWSVAALVASLLIAKRPEFVPEVSSISPWMMSVLIIGIILVGALFWTFALRKLDMKKVEELFAAGIGLAYADVLVHTVPGVWAMWWPAKLVLIWLLAFSVMFTYLGIVRRMQQSWEETDRWMWASNSIIVGVLVFAGIIIGKDLPPIVALVVLTVAAVYDAWAVWVSGIMQKMAQAFIDRRIVPGIAVALPKKKKLALIGGGDILFMVLVAVSYLKTSVAMAWLSAACMMGSLVVLFAFSKKGKFYPALPFILGGALAAVLFGVVL